MKKIYAPMQHSLLLALALCFPLLLNAQISQNYTFDANATGWTGTFARATTSTACGTPNMRYNLYSFATTANLISPNLGNVNGAGTVTLSYKYKVADWSANSVGTSNPWGNFNVQYGATASGPWTTIQTINQSNHIVSGNCVTMTQTFAPPAGALFIRFAATWSAGDYYLNFDDINVVENLPCTGAPTAGVAFTNTPMICAGGTTTLTASGLSNNTGISRQWQVSTVSGGPYTDVTSGTGATTTNYTTGALAAGTYYYVLKSTCSAASASSLSAEDTVIAMAVPTAPAATNSVQCGPQIPTASVSSTAGAGGTGTFLWYDAASGGNLVQGQMYSSSLSDYWVNNFSTTTLTNASLNDQAAISGGALVLQPSATSSAGALTVNPSGTNATQYKFEFDVTLTSQGTSIADGFSINFADDADGATTATAAEQGTGSKLRINFMTYNAANTNNGKGIYLAYGVTGTPAFTGTSLGVLAYNSTNLGWIPTSTSPITSHVVATINASGQLTLIVGTTTIFNNVQLPAAFINANKGNWKYVVKSRSGGVAGGFALDNFSIQKNNVVPGSTTYLSPVSTTTTFYVAETNPAGCIGARVPVTVTVNTPPAFDITNNKTVCNNAITALSVNSPAANYNTVTWSPVTNLYTDAAATVAYVANANASTVYYKNTSVGTVMYTANARNTSTQCISLDTIKIQTLPATTTAIAAVGTLCQTGSSTLSLSPAIAQTGLSYQWQNSTNNIAFTDITTNGTGATYTTPTITTTQYYRATIKNSDGAVCFNSVSDTVQVNNPQLLTTTPGERCGPGTVVLSATSNAGSTPAWFSAAAGGTALAVGTSFTTPSLAATTNYWVAARSNNTGSSICDGPRQQVTATVKTKPTATITPNGTINICNGTTQTLTAGGVGNYSWLKNNVLIPGQTGTTYGANQSGAYKAIVTNSVGCADTSVAANVSVNPNPVVNLGNDTAVCANIPLTLDAQNPGAAYLWNDNSTNSTLTATAAGQYRVKVTNSFNCATSDTINIAHLVVPVVNLGNDTMICHVQPLTLNAQNTGSSYAWSTGATTQTINVNQAGTYAVDVTNSNNCTGTDAIVITVMPNPVNHGFNFINLFNETIGKIRFEPIYADTTYTYAWDFGDGNTSTQMKPVHTYTASGDYVVSMNISNGCTDTTVSLPIRIDFLTGTASVRKNNIDMKLYPNPAQDQLSLELTGDHIFFKDIVIHNMIGQKVIDLKTNKTAAAKISIQALPAGIYVLKAETNKGMVIRKFEIIK